MSKLVWLYGWHPLMAIVQKQPERIQRVLLVKGRDSSKRSTLLRRLKTLQIQVDQLERSGFEKDVGQVQAHQGVAALCTGMQAESEAALFSRLPDWRNPVLLVLDRVQDPRNFGACLRVAGATSCRAVIVEKRRSAPLSAVAMKAACGSLVPLHRVTNLVSVLKKLKKQGFWVYGADPEAATSLFEETINHPCVWVVGSEDKGLRPLVKKCCDVPVRIPMQGTVASLNVSVAAAICLFESDRRQ